MAPDSPSRFFRYHRQVVLIGYRAAFEKAIIDPPAPFLRDTGAQTDNKPEVDAITLLSIE